jgi:hypothetical protein
LIASLDRLRCQTPILFGFREKRRDGAGLSVVSEVDEGRARIGA